MPKFHLGDRVESIHKIDCLADECIKIGDVGTVVHIDVDGDIGVSWDNIHRGGHTCDRNCKDGTGWYVRPDRIKLHEEDSTIEIDVDSFIGIVSKSWSEVE